MFDFVTLGVSTILFLVQIALVLGGVYFVGKLLIDYAIKQWKANNSSHKRRFL